MTVGEMERELDHIREDIAAAVAKIDSVIKSMGGFGERVSEAEGSLVRIEALLVRIEGNARDLHDDLFGKDGLSSRVRRAEEGLVHHGVWVRIVAAVACAILVVIAQHVVRGSDRADVSTATVGH